MLGGAVQITVFLIVCFVCRFSLGTEVTYSKHRHTDIVIIGGMGDLSKRYLMQGFYSLVTKYTTEHNSFTFYPTGRTDPESTEPILSKVLDERLTCEKTDGPACKKSKEDFINSVKYAQLKTDEHYKTFCDGMKIKWENLMNGKLNADIEVIFYLSIPSSGYLSAAKYINNYCRTNHKNWKVKVVLEKPFGLDRQSAKAMGLELSDSFNEEEIYRVDHYLGKTVVREILNFRKQNDHMEALLNKDHVEQVEIFMKETIGVQGRIDFYDQTGVMRDVFQNHLTELLTILAMEIPQNSSSSVDIKVNKLRLLKQIEPAKMSATLLGQFSDYLKDAEKEQADLEKSKFTPTFAAVMLKVHSPRWDGVPFILAGGKKLDERSGYVRVVFKRNTVCVNNCRDKNLQQLIFYIGHGQLKTPAILVSKSIGQPVWPQGVSDQSSVTVPSELFGQKSEDLFIGIPHKDPAAYTVLIEDLYLGIKDNFIGTNHLLSLWDIWTDVSSLSSIHPPKIYNAGDKDGKLSFRVTNNKLEYHENISDSVTMVNGEAPIQNETFGQTPSSFLGNKLITTDPQRLAFLLAEDIAHSIQKTLKRSLFYHIAFSGGKSPIILFETLAQHFADIPWRYVHIWQVDERCVPATDKDSNFGTIEEYLLKYVRLPYVNVHPMPVEITGKLCSANDNGLQLYQDLIKDQISDKRFDYIVLGLGADGHTASLFPNDLSLSAIRQFTAYAYGPEDSFETQRMTLTLPVINKAKQISVFVTGKGKRQILKQLEVAEGSKVEYPILGVKPDVGNVTWFIDSEALIDG
ncbi:GDH/6PGL endoplasmic bifunctional protein-like [Haliotis rubra]|uniref:GDH/6PGL endoplasmic bifunctional protein-like n=1 Tax=Haliotis rubra TaxID=36100 RepID=UPI001EE5ED25|nr:GDH/6PGL endoplasmic bifunctional protein-like [Haliotis rubra]